MRKEPSFAVEIGFTALHWIIQGYGYEITGGDVLEAFKHTMKAAANADQEMEALEQVKVLVTGNGSNRQFVREVLERRLK